jgi:hypothetical protein
MESRSTLVELSAHQGFRRAHSILLWSSRVLLVAGGFALVAFGVVYIRAQLFQLYLQDHFLKDTDVPGASWTFQPRAARFFAQNSDVTKAVPATTGDPPSGATPQSSALPPGTDTVGEIDMGDEIRFSTSASTFIYLVVSLRIVPPNAVEVLNNTQRPTLTMVTCYPFYYIGVAPKRFIVRAEMIRSFPR